MVYSRSFFMLSTTYVNCVFFYVSCTTYCDSFVFTVCIIGVSGGRKRERGERGGGRKKRERERGEKKEREEQKERREREREEREKREERERKREERHQKI